MQSKTYDKSYDYEEDKVDGIDYDIVNIFELETLQELRIDTDFRNAVTVTLLDGFAEVFGAELPPNTPIYYAKGSKFAIFTWHHAKIQVIGKTEDSYLSKETRMKEYIELHSHIQEERDNNMRERKPGPNVLICGESNSGKSTLCKILTNYGLKMGFRPILIDLDIENNMIVPPGCIGASRPKVNVPSDDLTEDTICYFYGLRASKMDGKLYKRQVSELAGCVNKKILNKEEEMKKELFDMVHTKEDPSKMAHMKSIFTDFSTSKLPVELASGCIINSMVVGSEPSERTVRFLADAFKISYIIVMESERTYIKLRECFQESSSIKIVKLPKSPGVAILDEANRRKATNYFFKNYFYGELNSAKALSPSFLNNLDTFEVGLKLDEYKLYTYELVKIPLSALPHGSKEEVNKIFVKKVDPEQMELQDRVVGVLDPVNVELLEKYEEEIEEGENSNKEEFYDILISSVCRSLIHISYYDPANNQLIANATSPEGPKSKYLIVKDLVYEKKL
ncbi:unnamed protein product [Moneuplotes crassus]|uniref:mRNA cleavage and polyadenylation factor CLP1 n=2 Tax=Euplotes crassus TaxID=5936 RepID=A0AAD1UBT7_EUPCR|nr:unnamed protein product [Moneuplotes crassus]